MRSTYVYCPQCRRTHDAPSCSIRRLKVNRNEEYSGIQISTFNPYVEDGFTGQPIEITSKAQRDALLAKHGCTYDKIGEHRPRVSTAASGVTLDEVVAEAERNGDQLVKEMKEAAALRDEE